MGWQKTEYGYIHGNGGTEMHNGGIGILIAHSYLNVDATDNKKFSNCLSPALVVRSGGLFPQSEEEQMRPTVLRIVLPGHQSGQTLDDLEKVNLGDFKKHFEKSADRLRAICKKGVILVGQSMGALLCLDYYFKRKTARQKNLPPILGMCLVSPPISKLVDAERENLVRDGKRYYDFRKQVFIESATDKKPDVSKSGIITHKFCPIGQLFDIWNLVDALKKKIEKHGVGVPTLIIHSGDDRLIYPLPPSPFVSTMYPVRDFFAGAKCKPVTYTTGKHLLLLDKKNFQTVLDRIVSFIAGKEYLPDLWVAY